MFFQTSLMDVYKRLYISLAALHILHIRTIVGGFGLFVAVVLTLLLALSSGKYFKTRVKKEKIWEHHDKSC